MSEAFDKDGEFISPGLQEHRTTIKDAWGREHDYYTTFYPAGKSYDLVPKIAILFSDSIGSVMDGWVKDSGKDLGAAITQLAERMQDLGGHEFALNLLSETTRDGVKLAEGNSKTAFNEAYQGNLLELFEALYWLMEVNYAPFFAGAKEAFRSLQEEISPLLQELASSGWLQQLASIGSSSESPESEASTE